jgi:hypothetical protein
MFNLQKFYNPHSGTPEEQGENALLEASAYTEHVPKREKVVHFQEISLLATMYDGNPEPKTFQETKQTQDS